MDKIIVFLTFSNPFSSLWAFPLIPYDNAFLIVNASISTHDPLRVFEEWIKKSKVSIGKKGHIYEDEIQMSLKSVVSNNKCLNGCRISKMTKNQIGEEIDMIIFLDSTLFVCEMKCNYIFASSRAYYSYKKDLKQASEQIKRKAKCIEDNLTKACTILNINNEGNITVKPLIISNLPYLSTQKIDDVLVTDIKSLSLYLSGSIVKNETQINMNGIDIQQSKKIPLYNSLKEASDNLLDFLQQSPFITRYKVSKEITQSIPILGAEQNYNLIIYDYILNDSLYETPQSIS